MPENKKCPICGGDPGVTDYLEKDTICQVCNSDLSIYRVTEQIPLQSKTTVSNKIWKSITAVALLSTAVAGIFAFSISNNKTSVQDNTDVEIIARLEQSKDSLNNRIKELEEELAQKTDGFAYTVRKGDSFCRISQKMYGNESKYKEIAETNNMKTTDPIFVGDVLYIK